MPFLFVIPHRYESDHNHHPVDVVRDDRADGCGILPAEEGVEDTPSSATINCRTAALVQNQQQLSKAYSKDK